MPDPAERLAQALGGVGRGHLLVVTGAGVSHASGIATFRGSDPDAVWKASDVEMATVRFFRQDPVEQWRWYLNRFEALEGARPNPAHRALARLEAWHVERGGDFLLVTQNIDTLHEQGGSERLVKVHGSSDRTRCTAAGCTHAAPTGSIPRSELDLGSFRADPSPERLPRCPRCDSLVRPHVLFFDEYYQEHRDYQFERVVAAAAAADLVLFVGTSFSVGVTDLVLRAAVGRRVPVFSVDPGASAPPARGVVQLQEPAEELLPEVRRLLAEAPGDA